MLPQQSFAGSPLCRLSDVPARFRAAALRPDAEVSLVVVAGREVVVRNAGGGSNTTQQQQQQQQSPAPPGQQHQQQELQALLLRRDDPELRLDGEVLALEWVPADGQAPLSLPLYLLGQDACARWTFALDVSEARDAFLEFLRGACGLEVTLRDARALLASLSLDACAIAGQAVALSAWHQTHRYCPRCGAPTVPSEAGTRRRCEGVAVDETSGNTGAQHRLYPRTDPVVIALVESPDGGRALLGRGAKSARGMYTCLSGFVEQCEGVEEAARREVMEEVRVAVRDVHVIGTQPWPIGRYGACELMIGCIAKASGYEVLLQPGGEVEDAQWYDRAELRAACEAYDGDVPVHEAQRRSWQRLGFFVPPPYAVAHHLIRAWAAQPGAWFGGGGEGGVQQQQQQRGGGGGVGGGGVGGGEQHDDEDDEDEDEWADGQDDGGGGHDGGGGR